MVGVDNSATGQITSGRDVFLDGLWRGHGLTIVAQRDINLAGKIKTLDPPPSRNSQSSFTAVDGDISVEPRAGIKGGTSHFDTTNGGQISFLDKSFISTKRGFIRMFPSGPLVLQNAKLTARGVDLDAPSITSTGLLKAKALTHDVDLSATGAIEIERMKADVKGEFNEFTATAASVEIGTPNSNGKVGASVIKAALTIHIDATGDVLLAEIRGQTATAVVETTGTLIELTGSRFSVPRNPGSSPPHSLQVNGGAGSSCDVTGTIVVGDIIFSVNCDAVVGP